MRKAIMKNDYLCSRFFVSNHLGESIEQYRDVEALNADENLQQKGKTREEALAILRAKSRDNARTAMQWRK
ncbi:MAG: hypothetical protein ACRC17_00830 [Culicoidibacterales bacterium]